MAIYFCCLPAFWLASFLPRMDSAFIYNSSPQAWVMTNGVRSSSFFLFQGIRQGCPLSLLLFYLALEPLAHTIQQASQFKGISTSCSFMLLMNSYSCLTQDTCVPYLKDLNNCLLGYKINWIISEALPINYTLSAEQELQWPFIWQTNSFTCLGLENLVNKTVQLNVDSIISQITSDLTE